ncbi:carbohydrate-binding module family 13 protein [Panaeolus papilionaceus]|nr:carbohydrate-binding module family 13 protein [Panaeolus papilionaceus]
MSHNVESGNKYFIRNVKGGTVIDLSGEDNYSIIGYPRNDGENQQWEVERVDYGWNIKNVQDGRYLALAEEAQDDLSVVVREDPFVWHLWGDEEIKNGVRICVPDTQQNIDLTNYGSEEPGTRVAIWGRWQANNQIWYFDEGLLAYVS